MDSRHHSCETPDFEAASYIDLDHAILGKIAPRSYKLQIPDYLNGDKVRIFVLGCQGEASDAQKQVAALMNTVAQDKEPLVIMVVGDNLYDAGAQSALDSNFNTCFYFIYYTDGVPNIQKVPAFMLLGNHDGNYDSKSASYNRYVPSMLFGKQTVGWEIEKHEIEETYLPTKTLSIVDKIAMFQQYILERDKLSAWNMPYPYYSLIIGEKEFFFVNSNSLFVDFLTYHEKINKGETPHCEKNQIAWLKKQYDKAVSEGRMPILLSHHPADITLGKRMRSFDAWHYGSDPQLATVNSILGISPVTESFTTLFHRILVSLGLHFPFKMCAHDHFINYVNEPEKNICQLTVGGGGGKWQSFMRYDYPYSGCQLQQYGFAALTIPLKNDELSGHIKKSNINIDIYTVDGLHLQYDLKSHLPNRWPGSEAYESLRTKIVKISKSYFDNLELPVKKQSSRYEKAMRFFQSQYTNANRVYDYMTKNHDTKKEPAIVQDIVAYFDQLEAPTASAAFEFLQKKIILLKQFPETDKSFLSALQQELPELFFEMLTPTLPSSVLPAFC